MTDFEYDIKQRKALSRSAFAKKNGSKSKKCTLPSDRLTEAQIRRLSGPVITYNLSKPMSYDTYKTLPYSVRKEYLEKLTGEFNASSRKICAMMHTSQYSVERELKQLGIPTGGPHRYMTQAQAAAWDGWTHATDANTEAKAPSVIETTPDPDSPPVVPTAPDPGPATEPQPSTLLSGCYTLAGSVRDIIAELYLRMDLDRNAEITVEFTYGRS